MFSRESYRGNNFRGIRAGRGSHRARGDWRGSSRTFPPRPQPRTNEAFGPRIDSFNVKSLLIEEESPEIKDVKYVGSYNWVNDSSPCILVPGQSFSSHRCPFSKWTSKQYPVVFKCGHVLTLHMARFSASMDSVGKRHQASTR